MTATAARLVLVGLAVVTAAGPIRARDQRAVFIAGSVIDAVSKEPIAGVRVSAWGRGLVPDWAVTTGPLGEFEFRSPSPGPYRLLAAHPRYLPESGEPGDPVGQVTLTADAPMAGLVLVLSRKPIVSGTVRDEAGEPIVDVEVAAVRRVAGSDLGSDPTTRTDDRGAYRIVLRSPATDYLIRVRGDSARPAVPTGPPAPQPDAVLTFPTMFYPASPRPSGAHPVNVALNEERIGVNFALHRQRGVTIAGTIDGADRVPYGLLPMSLLDLDGGEVQWDPPVASIRAGIDGRFSFINVPPGSYLLWAVAFPRHQDRPTPTIRAPGVPVPGVVRVISGGGPVAGPPPDGDTLWIRTPVVVEDHDVELRLSLNRGTRISGRVVFDGASPRPIASELEATALHVYAVDGATLGSVPIGGLGPDGRFSTVGFPPGAYELYLFGPGFSAWRMRSLTVNGRDVTDRPIQVGSNDIGDVVWTYTDRQTRLSGQLRDRQGREVAAMHVAVFPTDRSLWLPGVLRQPALVANLTQAGEFDITVRGAGEYFVTSVPAGLKSSVQDLAVLERLSRTATVVHLGEGEHATIDLRVPVAQ